MKAGAVEFLTKPFRDQDLLDAVRIALEKDRERRERKKEVSDLKERYNSLTPREQEVISMVVSGMLNKQIADQLATARRTKAPPQTLRTKARPQTLVNKSITLVVLSGTQNPPMPNRFLVHL